MPGALDARSSGLEHPATMIILYNLGFVLADLGRVDEAEKLIRQALESLRQVLGPEHPSTLYTTRELGIRLEQDGSARRGREATPALSRGTAASSRSEPIARPCKTAAQLDAVVKDAAAKLAEAKPPAAPDGPHDQARRRHRARTAIEPALVASA